MSHSLSRTLSRSFPELSRIAKALGVPVRELLE
jgi:lambda repressor-like predicted transcriptional regulator